MSSDVAVAGVFALAILAPFEMTTPLVRLPWQSLSNLEAVLALSIASWGAALVASRCLPAASQTTSTTSPSAVSPARLPLVAVWPALVAAMALASAAAPLERANAWHMTGRVAAAGIVYVLTLEGVRTRARLRLALTLCVVAGLIVALLAMLEYLQVGTVLRALRVFRPAVTAVGDQVRAGGPLQYPTITSMYLEVVFAFGLGLMVSALDASERVAAAIWFVALAAIAQAITLTFTRAGLVTMASSLALVGLLRLRQHGFDRGVRLVSALAVVVAAMCLTSRSADALWLRMTSEGQDSWYQASVEAPAELSFDADGTRAIAVRATNTGRVTWKSDGARPILLSYHWLNATGDRVVAYEGARAAFEQPVLPGERAAVDVAVRAPRVPGRYVLEWDLVQEDRLWFSTEQGAPEPASTAVVVTGGAAGEVLPTYQKPRRAVRPGRRVLWGTAARMVAAHPILGVGPDNFRLLYGSYAGLPNADRRTHSNSMYLEVLVGGGLVGAAAFAVFARRASRLFVSVCKVSDPEIGATGRSRGQTPYTPLHMGIAAAGLAIALHGTVDSFLSFSPTYILFALTLGFAAAVARGVETAADAHCV